MHLSKDNETEIKEETKLCLDALKEYKDAESRQLYIDRIYELNAGLIIDTASKLAGKYKVSRGSADWEDLESILNVAFFEAIEKFDSSKEAAFSTFVTKHMIISARKYFADQSSLISIPKSDYDNYGRISKAKTKLENELGREPTKEEILQETHMREKTYRSAMVAHGMQTISSLNELVGEDGDSASLENFVEDPDSRIENSSSLLTDGLEFMWEELGRICTKKELEFLPDRENSDDGNSTAQLEYSEAYVYQMKHRIQRRMLRNHKLQEIAKRQL